jgi:outer membrane protein
VKNELKIRMSRKTLILIILILSSSSFARTLSWSEAVDLAQKNSAELQAATETYNAALASESSAAAGFMPRLSANLRGTHSGSSTTSSQFNYGADLTLTQNLFSGFSDYYSYKIKKNTTAQALLDLKIAQSRISQELKQTYSETYFTQVNKKLTEAILKRREENFKSVQLQYEIGRENKGSLLLSQSYVEQARYDVMRAGNEADNVLENFRRFLGLPDTEEILLENNIAKDETPQVTPNFKELAQNHYTLLKAKNDTSLAEMTYQQSRSKFIPSLNFNASYGKSGAKYFPDQDSWSLGLTFSVPIFDGFIDTATYRSNFYKSQSSVTTLRNTEQTVLRDLKRTFYDYIESLQKEKVDNSFNQAALLRSDIARNKYKNGLLSFEDWDLIESDLIQKQKEILLSEKNRIVKQSLWERTQGIGVFK